MSFFTPIAAELDRLRETALLREPRVAAPAGAADFASTDYLGVGRHPLVIAALCARDRAGSGGSRLLGGAHPEFSRLETELAAWTGREAARLFSSGYLAALGAIVTLGRFAAHARSDALVHACAIDALRLMRCERAIFPHGTLAATAPDGEPTMVVTESVFSMDGDRAPLGAQLAALGPRDVLVVDEAHALGVAGARGAGLAADLADPRIVVIGTLSKALGAAGGFVAGPAALVALLGSAARTFVYDTAPPPAVAAAASAALAIVRGGEGDALRARLERRTALVRDGLAARGIATAPGDGPIVVVPVGEDRAALTLAARLAAAGVFAPAIRPPTVPAGTARLRLVVRADHTAAEIDRLLAAFDP